MRADYNTMSAFRDLRLSVLLVLAIVMLLALSFPARATIDVTLDIAGAPSSPEVDQRKPGRMAATGFDPLPLGATAALFVAIGFLSLRKQTASERRGSS